MEKMSPSKKLFFQSNVFAMRRAAGDLSDVYIRGKVILLRGDGKGGVLFTEYVLLWGVVVILPEDEEGGGRKTALPWYFHEWCLS